ncbi:MAG TPA: hypothetical protein VI793_16585 [Anaerolineales bacterium]|nr:hypothetical protein [Anaerolineales bacterium]
MTNRTEREQAGYLPTYSSPRRDLQGHIRDKIRDVECVPTGSDRQSCHRVPGCRVIPNGCARYRHIGGQLLGKLVLLGLTFKVGKRGKGQYVKAVLDTQCRRLTVYSAGRIAKSWPYVFLNE